MKTLVRYRYPFEADHHYPDGDPNGRCGAKLHGHDWWAEFTITDEPVNGRVLVPAHRLADLVAELDQRMINDMIKGSWPSPEGIAAWMLERLRLSVPGLSAVTVGFANHSACVEV